VLQICDSLRKHGFHNIFLFNSHGGNNAALSMAINIAYEQWRERIYLVHWADLAVDVTSKIGGPKIHIEEVETSLALALGQRVDMEKARRDAYDRREALKAKGQPTSSLVNYDASHRGPSIGVSMNYVREISSSGVIGDATRANKETGAEIIKVVVARLVDAIAELNER
jgi:creatinine amidohydrolase/Fe(II)-dependent formamide hydrolase-like protein